ISDSADRTSLHVRKLFCRSDLSSLLDCVGDRAPWTGKSARKRQGRPSRGTPTPPGYGYLTYHLPREVTLAWINDSATDRQVVMLEMRGKKTQLFNTTIKCLGLGGREKHAHATDKLFLQVQASAGEQQHPRRCFHPR